MPLIIVDTLFASACLMISQRTASLWRYLFMLLSLSSIAKVIITVTPLTDIIASNSTQHLATSNLSNIVIHIISLLSETAAWLILCAYFMLTANKKRYKFIPYLPTLITVILVIVFISSPLHQFTAVTNDNIWNTLMGCRDFALFAIILFCLPMFRNIYLTMLAEGFLILIIGDIVKLNINFSAPYVFTLWSANFYYLLGKLFLLYSAAKLLLMNDYKKADLFYQVDNTRTQILYWGNSITATLFLLLGVKILILDQASYITNLLFNTNVRLLVPFVSLLILFTFVFTQMFSHDFSEIKNMITKLSNKLTIPQRLFAKINFFELRHLARFIKDKMQILSEKNATQEKFFKAAGQAAHDIRTPLSVLSILSSETEKQLNQKEWQIYKSALARIKVSANDLLALQKKSADEKNLEKIISAQSQYIAIAFVELMQHKSIQHSHLGINITYSISPSAWFVIANIDTHPFNRVISDLINNAISATQQQQQRDISCQLKYTTGEPHFTLTVKDTGPGLSDHDIDAILSEELQGHSLNYVMKKVRLWKGSTHIKSEHGVEISLILPITQPTPKWWINQITLPTTGTIIIFDDDPLAHQQWQQILTPHTKYHSEIKILHCYDEDKFTDYLDTSDNKLILIDYDIEGAEKLGLDYIRQFELREYAILVTNNYQLSEVQNQCETDGVFLLPKPLITHVEIRSDSL